MGYLIKSASTAKPLLFLMVDSTDHVTGKTGLTPTVTLSKNGAAFASPAGAVTELSGGWYKVAGSATDTNTVGPLILHATASGADPADEQFNVVAFDPDDAAGLGLSRIDAAVSSRMATYTQPSGFLAATFPGTVASPTNITAGTITTVTTLTNLPTAPTDWLTAAAVKADAVTKIQTGLSTLTAAQVWGAATSGLTGAGSIGLLLVTDIDAAISSVSGGGGSGLTAQQVRDAMKLAPTAGSPAADSVDDKLDGLVPGSAVNEIITVG